jgi:hypothetical protein
LRITHSFFAGTSTTRGFWSYVDQVGEALDARASSASICGASYGGLSHRPSPRAIPTSATR